MSFNYSLWSPYNMYDAVTGKIKSHVRKYGTRVTGKETKRF